MMQAMAQHLRFSAGTINLVATDLDEDDARRRARGNEGASIAWVLGHLINYRYRMMALLGAEKTNPLADTFTKHATDGSDYPTMAELVSAWNTVTGELNAVTETVADEQLQSPPASAPHREKTVMDTLSFLVWHESYHIGQLGTLRTQMGYTPTAELAVAASKQKK